MDDNNNKKIFFNEISYKNNNILIFIKYIYFNLIKI